MAARAGINGRGRIGRNFPRGTLGGSAAPHGFGRLQPRCASLIADLTQTGVIGGDSVTVLSWYDNEWGFGNRMPDTRVALMNAR